MTFVNHCLGCLAVDSKATNDAYPVLFSRSAKTIVYRDNLTSYLFAVTIIYAKASPLVRHVLCYFL